MQCLQKGELIRVYVLLVLVLILLVLLLGLLLAYVICPWIWYELQRNDPDRTDPGQVPAVIPLLSVIKEFPEHSQVFGRLRDTSISFITRSTQRSREKAQYWTTRKEKNRFYIINA